MTSQERAVTALRNQKLFTLAAVVFGPSLSWMLVGGFTGLMFWFTFIPLTVGLMWTLRFVFSILNVFLVYRNHFDELVPQQKTVEKEEEPKIETQQMLIAGLPEKPIGKFKDVDFFEWIDFGIDDLTIRGKFYGTVDVDHSFNIPSDCVLLHPGLLYQLDPEDNRLTTT